MNPWRYWSASNEFFKCAELLLSEMACSSADGSGD